MKRKPDIRKPPYGEQILPFRDIEVLFHIFYYSRTPSNGLFFVPADSPYIDSCLNLSTTATAT